MSICPPVCQRAKAWDWMAIPWQIRNDKGSDDTNLTWLGFWMGHKVLDGSPTKPQRISSSVKIDNTHQYGNTAEQTGNNNNNHPLVMTARSSSGGGLSPPQCMNHHDKMAKNVKENDSRSPVWMDNTITEQ